MARGGSVFVGRAGELAELDRLLEATRAGAGSTVLIAGEAGIGKTRLVSELAARADAARFEVLLGRSIDLVGTELPFQPFLEALRPLGTPLQGEAGSQLRTFEDTLGVLSQRTASAPVLLALEDLHWADTSTLDLFLFLAYNVADRRLLLVGTHRPDEASSAERMRRVTAAVRRSGSGVMLELGPLDRAQVKALLAARACAPPPAALTEAIVTRCEGNPFFAEELFAAVQGDAPPGELPRHLRDLLLQRVAQLGGPTQSLVRLASAAGRDVGYPLLHAVAARPEHELQDSLREAVEHAILVPVEASGRFRFRHALLAEAVYSTLLPGEREELHGKLAEELAGKGGASPAELAPHWAAAGRHAEALVASVQAARQAQAVFGLSEALGHLERALTLWPQVTDAADLVQLDQAGLCSWAADLATETGAAPRAVELGRRAIELVGDGDPRREALLHVRLARHLHASGLGEAALATFEHAVELAPVEPPSPERAHALAAFANGLMLAWRYEQSLQVSERALTLARTVGDENAELRALTVRGVDLAYLGRGDEGVSELRQVLLRAKRRADPESLMRVYVNLTDVLMMLGRLHESAELGREAVQVFRRYSLDDTTLKANLVEALVASGEWDEADTLSAQALRAVTANYPHHALVTRGELEAARGDYEAARAHLEPARATLSLDRDLAAYAAFVADLALWERRWTDVESIVLDGLGHARAREMAVIRVQLCAKGLRAQAELAALARARRDAKTLRDRLDQADGLRATAVQAGAEAAGVAPSARGWLVQSEAEHARAHGRQRPELWAQAADIWGRLERPPLGAYCRWREAEALVAAGASRAEAAAPLRAPHAVASRLRAGPLLREIELLAQRARLDLTPATVARGGEQSPAETLGLTRREAEVLELIARGYTNREIAKELFISIKTAGVHVSHILHKLDAPNRLEAAAIIHRVEPPQSGGR